MNHSEVQSRLANYLEGELAMSERALLDAHLDACTDCSQDVRELRATIDLVRSLPEPELPPYFTQSVLRRLDAGEGRPPAFDRVLGWLDPGRFNIALPATAVATAVVVLFATGQFRLPESLGVPAMQASAPTPVARRNPVRIRVKTEGTRAARAQSMWVARLGTPSLGASSVVDQSPSFSRVVSDLRGTSPGRRVSTDASGSASSSADRATRRRSELDGRLNLLLTRPEDFTRQFADLSLAERELWLPPLAERAGERGLSHRVVKVLYTTGDPQALTLAEAFAAAAQHKQARLSR